VDRIYTDQGSSQRAPFLTNSLRCTKPCSRSLGQHDASGSREGTTRTPATRTVTFQSHNSRHVLTHEHDGHKLRYPSWYIRYRFDVIYRLRGTLVHMSDPSYDCFTAQSYVKMHRGSWTWRMLGWKLEPVRGSHSNGRCKECRCYYFYTWTKRIIGVKRRLSLKAKRSWLKTPFPQLR
jgi:hypothetical protein